MMDCVPPAVNPADAMKFNRVSGKALGGVAVSDDALGPRPLGIGLLAFAAIFVLVGLDLLGDYSGGISTPHLVVELAIMALSAAGVVYLVLRLRDARSTVVTLAAHVESARIEAERWRGEAEDLLGGLSTAITRQFDRWTLTDAERYVALGLLRGRSHKAIARERHTSERTVRQQARSVYQKAGLAGRSELAAFFLDGLPTR